jgi:hypothetical protein
VRGAAAATIALALLLPASGCLDLLEPPCPDLTAPDFAFPLTSGAFLAADPTQPWDSVVRVNGTGGPAPARLWTQVDGKEGGEWQLIKQEDNISFGAVSFQPGSADHDLQLTWSREYDGGHCYTSRGGSVAWELSSPREGETATVDEGALVYTAGFWENGTLFYTNIKEVDAQAWPRAGWYEWEGADPLPVYVYDQDRAEQPPHWRAPSSSVPPTGSPADPIMRETLGGVESMYGVGYYTTIQGFNEALKGLSTHTTRVVRLAPEEAYTLPGNEDHPLYGDALVFYIKIVEVRPLPCPTQMDVECRTPALGIVE